MARNNVRIHVRQNGPLEGSAKRATRDQIFRLADNIEDSLHSLVPKGETHNLEASLYVYVDTNLVIHAGADHTKAPYARMVHDGTAPHRIDAKPGKILAWQDGGQTRFAKYVYHPGTRPQPFLRDALRLNRGKVNR